MASSTPAESWLAVRWVENRCDRRSGAYPSGCTAIALTMAQTVNNTRAPICIAMSTYCTLAETWMPMATKMATKRIQHTPPTVTQNVELASPSRPKKRNMYCEAICTRFAITIVEAATAAKPTSSRPAAPWRATSR